MFVPTQLQIPLQLPPGLEPPVPRRLAYSEGLLMLSLLFPTVPIRLIHCKDLMLFFSVPQIPLLPPPPVPKRLAYSEDLMGDSDEEENKGANKEEEEKGEKTTEEGEVAQTEAESYKVKVILNGTWRHQMCDGFTS